MYSRLKNKLTIEVFIWIHYTAFCIICNILTFSIWFFSQNTKGFVIMKDNKYIWRIEELVKGEFGADGNLKDSQVKAIHHPSRYPSPITAPGCKFIKKIRKMVWKKCIIKFTLTSTKFITHNLQMRMCVEMVFQPKFLNESMVFLWLGF